MEIPRVHLDNIGKIGGFAFSDARAGEAVSVCTRASLTSDDDLFYEIMEGVSVAILSQASFFVNGIYQFLAVLHDDDTADLYVNEFPVLVKTTAKASMAKGQVVSLDDIADIQSLEFEGSLIGETDKLIYCFKVGWKFGLFFDLKRQSAPDYRLNLEQVGESIGGLYRYLAFQHVYKTLESKPQFEQMMNDGWFPFVELLGSDFKSLSQVYNAMFDVDARISQLRSEVRRGQNQSDHRAVVAPSLLLGETADLAGGSERILAEYPRGRHPMPQNLAFGDRRLDENATLRRSGRGETNGKRYDRTRQRKRVAEIGLGDFATPSYAVHGVSEQCSISRF